jgi:hypothetical protein
VRVVKARILRGGPLAGKNVPEFANVVHVKPSVRTRLEGRNIEFDSTFWIVIQ